VFFLSIFQPSDCEISCKEGPQKAGITKAAFARATTAFIEQVAATSTRSSGTQLRNFDWRATWEWIEK